MIKIKYKLLTLAIVLSFSYKLSAQNTDLPSEQVEVIKDFEARIIKAKIIPFAIQVPPPDTIRQFQYTYELSPTQLQITPNPPTIRPLAMKREAPEAYYPLLLKAGYGTQNSPYAKLSYNYFNGQNLQLHLDGLYNAAHSNQIQNQRFQDIDLNAGVLITTEAGMAINSSFGYRSSNNFLYGYDHDIESFTAEQAQRPTKSSKIELGISNAYTTEANVDYRLSASVEQLKDLNIYKENTIKINGGLKKWIGDHNALGIDIGWIQIAPQDSLENTLNHYQIKPFYKLSGNIVQLRAGVNIAKNNTVAIYPDAEAQINILPGRLLLFGGWTGGLKTNSQLQLLQINPYLRPGRDSLITSTYQEIYAGVRGAYKALHYELKAGYENINQLPLYAQYQADTRFLDILYDDTKILRMGGQVTAAVHKKAELQAAWLYNIYNTAQQDKAWHLPAFDLQLGGILKLLENKLRLEAYLKTQNGVPVLHERNRLNALADLSIGLDYLPFKNIGLYLQANNLLNNKRERWINYPSFGMNLHGGLLLRF